MNRLTQQIQLNGLIYTNENIDSLVIETEPADSWRNAIYHFLKNWFDDTDYIIAHTSGSTGIPKEIRLLKTAMHNSAQMTNTFFGLDHTKTALHCLPASYIAGKMMLVRAIVGGYNLITVEPKANPFENLEVPIDFTAITPYQLHYSAETLQQKNVAEIIVGGGHVNSKLEKSVQAIPSRFYETYGMTETSSHIALRCFKGENKSDFFSVLDGVFFRLDSRDCIAIKAPHLFPGEIQTNDIVKLYGKNQFKWLGRADLVINSGGVKIHPEQIEKKLENIISSKFFIGSMSDEIVENKIVLLIETSENNISKDVLFSEIKEVLDKYEIPKQIYFLPKFAYSDNNKLLRKETLALI